MSRMNLLSPNHQSGPKSPFCDIQDEFWKVKDKLCGSLWHFCTVICHNYINNTKHSNFLRMTDHRRLQAATEGRPVQRTAQANTNAVWSRITVHTSPATATCCHLMPNFTAKIVSQITELNSGAVRGTEGRTWWEVGRLGKGRTWRRLGREGVANENGSLRGKG